MGYKEFKPKFSNISYSNTLSYTASQVETGSNAGSGGPATLDDVQLSFIIKNNSIPL